jgi:hypothetical protein
MNANPLYFSIIVIFIIFLNINPVNSQDLMVTSDIIPDEMVEILIGSGLDYNNVVYTGADISRGSFWGGPGSIGVSNGIILTSGSVNVAPGPNDSGNAGFNANTPGDLDLDIISGCETYDACVLEFDFVPQYQYVWFDYVFASEEYHEYVYQFNDAFGFFISGPGIIGPYSNGSENIALIPLTNIPVTINTVNCGNPYNCEYYCTNCQFFVNNSQVLFTQYDAFTTVLTAWAEVEPYQTYHIKLDVGDGLDHVYDSGVFLQASSFCSGPATGITGADQKDTGENYNVYPVPAGDVLNIYSQDGQDFTVQLNGQDGRNWRSISGKSQVTFDMSSVPAGIYILKIIDNTGITARKIFKN